MSNNGEIALARAIGELGHIHYNTQLEVGVSTVLSAFSYVNIVKNWSGVLSADEQECSSYTMSAFGQSGATEQDDLTQAAIWHQKYQSDSIALNKAIGTQNATMNNEEMQQHQQAQNLTPVYAVFEYVALLFLTTSGLLTRK